jgi:hypothetical protein
VTVRKPRPRPVLLSRVVLGEAKGCSILS